jgi:hypothetical protein
MLTPETFTRADAEFHGAVAVAAHNVFLQSAVATVRRFAAQSDLLLFHGAAPGSLAEAGRQHVAIAEAIADGDAERSAGLMAAHIESFGGCDEGRGTPYGNPDTFTQASGQYLWQLVVDLQQQDTLGYLTVTMPQSNFATAFHVDASTDGTTWTTVGSVTDTGWGTIPVVFSSPVTGSQPSYADDGNPATVSQATDQYRWIQQIDLQKLESISVISLLQPDSAFATNWHIDVSVNGSTWWTVARHDDAAGGLSGV